MQIYLIPEMDLSCYNIIKTIEINENIAFNSSHYSL